MRGAQKYVEKTLTGADLEMADGRKVRVVSVGDYEPADPSVGIGTGGVTVTGDDGKDYDVLDNGDVTEAGETEKIGAGPDLIPCEMD